MKLPGIDPLNYQECFAEYDGNDKSVAALLTATGAKKTAIVVIMTNTAILKWNAVIINSLELEKI